MGSLRVAHRRTRSPRRSNAMAAYSANHSATSRFAHPPRSSGLAGGPSGRGSRWGRCPPPGGRRRRGRSSPGPSRSPGRCRPAGCAASSARTGRCPGRVASSRRCRRGTGDRSRRPRRRGRPRTPSPACARRCPRSTVPCRPRPTLPRSGRRWWRRRTRIRPGGSDHSSPGDLSFWGAAVRRRSVSCSCSHASSPVCAGST